MFNFTGRKFSAKLIAIVLMVFVCDFALSTTIHVPGDQETIQAGIDIAVSGDSVLVANGTYLENIDFLGKAITVISENGPAVTTIAIANSGSPVVSFVNSENQNSILQGFTIDGDSTYWGVLISNSSPYIYNNNIKNHVIGIRVDSGAPIIRRNEISYCNTYQNGGGIRVSSANGVVIDSNIVHDNWGDVAAGIFLYYVENSRVSRNLIYSNRSVYIGAVGMNFCSNVAVINNTIVNNSRLEDFMGAIGMHDCHSMNIYNNIISSNNDWGIHAWQGSSDNFADYNDFYDNSYGDIYGIDNIGENNLFLDPLFVDMANDDFHLLAESPCIDAGDPESPLDPDGSRADIGALFFGAAPGDLKLDIADVYGEQGSVVPVPVYAEGFSTQSVAGVELHITFNSECISYHSFSSDYLVDALVNAEDGQVNILWEDYENPLAIPEGAALLNIHFNLLADMGTTCQIEWLDNNELGDPEGEAITGIEYFSGSVVSTILSDLSGHVIYYDLVTSVPEVGIELSGNLTGEALTDEFGNYGLENLPSGNYTLCASKSADDFGVTVNDVVLIRRHIVLLEPFTSPYLMIAADVNQNDRVSVTDIIKIRRYLAELDELPSGNWAFVDSGFVLTFDNWTEAPACREVELGNEDIGGLNFIGVRMGDVDMSYCCEDGGLACLDDSVTVTLRTVNCEPGEVINVPVTVDGFTDVAGLEIHVDYPAGAIEYLGINSEILTDPTVNGGEGRVHLVWEDIENLLSLADGTELLQLELRVSDAAPDTIPVTFTRTYVCDQQGEDFAVGTYDGSIITGPTGIDDDAFIPSAYLLKQNYPNPFNATTSIELQLPQETSVNLVVYDIQGRAVEVLFTGDLPAGVHHIRWAASQYPSGIYIYKLQAGDFTETRKMLLLK